MINFPEVKHLESPVQTFNLDLQRHIGAVFFDCRITEPLHFQVEKKKPLESRALKI